MAVVAVIAPAVEAAVARPTNYTRNVFHIFSGLLALLAIRVMPSRAWLIGVAVVFAGFAWCAEAARRRSSKVNASLMRFFAPVAHPHEYHRVNSSTWYATALLILAVLAPLRAAEVGLVVLAVADPIAGLIGRRFGRTRLRANRSLEGSLGFLVAGGLAVGVWLSMMYGMPPAAAAVLGGMAALAGAIAELVTTDLDDNVTIPTVTAAVFGLAQWTMGGLTGA